MSCPGGSRSISTGSVRFLDHGCTDGGGFAVGGVVEVLEYAYVRLGFDRVCKDTFRKLVLDWVVEPTSKANMLRVRDGAPYAR